MQNKLRISQQLYPLHDFQLPAIGDIEVQPFKNAQTQINKLPDPQLLSPGDIPVSYIHKQEEQFYRIIKEQKAQVCLIDITEKYLHVCSKQHLISCSLSEVEKYEKVKLPQKPACLKSEGELIYLGFESGKIIVYSLITKNIQSQCEQFVFRICKIYILKQSTILVMDSVGNIKCITFNSKSILKLSVSVKDIVILVKEKKREKIKKLFNKVFKKQSQQAKPNESEIAQQNEVHNFSILPYCLHSQNFHIPIVIYSKSTLKIVYVHKDTFEIRQEQILMQDVDEIGMMQFGKGGFVKSNQSHILLTISHHNTLMFYRQVIMEDAVQYLKVSQLTHNCNIVDGKFISNNLLIFITQNGVQLSNVNEELSIITKMPIQYNKYNKNKRDVSLCIANNNYVVYNNISNVMIKGHIYKWDQYINKLADQYQWEKCMKCALMIYEGIIKNLADINENIQKRNKEMKNLFQKLTLTFIAFEVKKEQKDVSMVIKQGIDFMVRTQSFQYLFTTIYEGISNLGLVNEFISELTVYIQTLSIPFMTQDVLSILIQHYKQEQNIKILQLLIMGFDLSLMESSYLLSVCLSYELYYPLIHICKKQNDYVTPLIKLCGLRMMKQKQEKWDQCNRIRDIVYWFIRQCLVGHMTQYGNQQLYINMLQQIINFMFIPSSIQMLYTTSDILLIRTVNMFFQPKTMQYILQNAHRFFIKTNSHIDQVIFKKGSIEQFRVYEKMLATLIFTIQQTNERDQVLWKFVTYLILKNSMPFTNEYKIKAFKFFVQSPFILSNHHNNEGVDVDEQQQIKVNAYLRRMLDSTLRQIQQHQIQIVLTDLLGSISLSKYNGILGQGKCYIYHELGQSAQALQTYIHMKNTKLKGKVFLFLRQNLFQPIKNWNALSYKFISNLDYFLKESRQQTMQILIQVINRNPNIQAIQLSLSHLSQPTLQLQFIECIINNVKNGRDKLMMKHLNIVIQHQIQKLQDYIFVMDYPLQQCYRICEQINNKSGMAFILIKSGRNKEGTKILVQLFVKVIQQGLKALGKKQQFEGYPKARQQLHKILRTCEKEYEIDSIKGQQMWQLVIQSIFHSLNIKNLNIEKLPQQIKVIIEQIIQLLISAIFSIVSSQFFMKFSNKFNNLPIKIYIKAFQLIVSRAQFEHNVNFLAFQLIRINSIKHYSNLTHISTKGILCKQSDCNICMEDNIGQTVVVYNCSHLYHFNCLQTQYCPQCRKQWDVLQKCRKQEKIEYERYYLTHDQRQNEEKKMRIGKMRQFDIYSEEPLKVYTKYG